MLSRVFWSKTELFPIQFVFNKIIKPITQESFKNAINLSQNRNWSVQSTIIFVASFENRFNTPLLVNLFLTPRMFQNNKRNVLSRRQHNINEKKKRSEYAVADGLLTSLWFNSGIR